MYVFSVLGYAMTALHVTCLGQLLTLGWSIQQP